MADPITQVSRYTSFAVFNQHGVTFADKDVILSLK